MRDPGDLVHLPFQASLFHFIPRVHSLNSRAGMANRVITCRGFSHLVGGSQSMWLGRILRGIGVQYIRALR